MRLSHIINKASTRSGSLDKRPNLGIRRRFNSHSKTACREFEPFCPCHETA